MCILTVQILLVWLELGRQLDGGVLISSMIMLYVEALQAEVEAFSERINQMEKGGMI